MAKKSPSIRTFSNALSSFTTQVTKTNVVIQGSKDKSKALRDSDAGKAAKDASKDAQKSIGLSICAALGVEKDFGAMSGQTKEALAIKDAFNEAFAKLNAGDDTLRIYRRIVCFPQILAYVPANSSGAVVRNALAKVEWTNANGKPVTGVGETPSQMRKFVEAHKAAKTYDDGVTAEAIKFLSAEMAKGAKGLAGHLDAKQMNVDSPIGIAVQDMFQLMVSTDADELDAGEVDIEDGPELPAVDLGTSDNRQVSSSV